MEIIVEKIKYINYINKNKIIHQLHICQFANFEIRKFGSFLFLAKFGIIILVLCFF